MIRKFLVSLGLMLAFYLPAVFTASTAYAQSFNARGVINVSASGANTIITGVAGQQIYIYGFDLTLASSNTIQLYAGSTALTGVMTLTAYTKPIISDTPYWVIPAGQSFVISLGTGVQCSGAIWYRQQ